MSAARTLGWPQVGLAAILDTHFGVTMNKKYQRADWKRRPLTPEQLDYARLDTHYLAGVARAAAPGADRVAASGRRRRRNSSAWRGCAAESDSERPDPAAFWRVKGARDLTPAQAAILQALFAYREQQAERIGSSAVQGDGRGDADGARPPRTASRRRPAGHARDDAGADPPLRAAACCTRSEQGLARQRRARLRPIASPTKCAIGTIACTPGARTGRGRAASSRMSSFRARRSGISPAVHRAPTANWRRLPTSDRGAARHTATRFWRCSHASQHLAATDGRRTGRAVC